MSALPPTCFVVQGFGPKTDYTDGRVLNLDASYEVVRQAVRDAGLQCIRADEIIHSGTIDVPMYEQLLRADLVIADLSTYNVNAAFELGVRYGLRPHATIVIAEEQFKSPFDIGHIVIRRYKHLGEDIGVREAGRFKAELSRAIREVMQAQRTDSPVYSMLHGLQPPNPPARPAARPADLSDADAVAVAFSGAVETAAAEGALTDTLEAGVLRELDRLTPALPMQPLPPGAPMSARDWLERGCAASQQGHFAEAIEAWSALRRLMPGDTHALQQLALATYKLRLPTPQQALLDAREMLRELSPATTNDPETVALWGTIHRRLWELRQGEDLSVAINAYERSFLLKQDHFNGTSLAFLLLVRAIVEARAGRRDEAVADRVQSARVRRELIQQVQPLAERPDLADRHRFWYVAGLWFACLALGDEAGAATWDERARSLKVDKWMQHARTNHAERLCGLLAELSTLLSGTAP